MLPWLNQISGPNARFSFHHCRLVRARHQQGGAGVHVLQSFTLMLEQRLNSLIIPLPHPCSVLLLNKTSMSIAQKTHHTLAGIQLSHNNIEWGEGGFKYVFHRV